MTPEQNAEFEKVYGIPLGSEWSKEVEERFADDFTRYVDLGVAPTEGLRSIFALLRGILERVKSALGPIDASVAVAFDRLFSGKLNGGKNAESAAKTSKALHDSAITETSSLMNSKAFRKSIEKMSPAEQLEEMRSLISQRDELFTNIDGVWVHNERLINHQDSFGDELEALKFLHDTFDLEVYMIPELDNDKTGYVVYEGKRPDGFTRGLWIDCKKTVKNEEKSNDETTIRNAIRKGVKQADAVFVVLDRYIDKKAIKKSIQKQLNASFGGGHEITDRLVLIKNEDDLLAYEIRRGTVAGEATIPLRGPRQTAQDQMNDIMDKIFVNKYGNDIDSHPFYDTSEGETAPIQDKDLTPEEDSTGTRDQSRSRSRDANVQNIGLQLSPTQSLRMLNSGYYLTDQLVDKLAEGGLGADENMQKIFQKEQEDRQLMKQLNLLAEASKYTDTQKDSFIGETINRNEGIRPYIEWSTDVQRKLLIMPI